jgi:hypothetical protein
MSSGKAQKHDFSFGKEKSYKSPVVGDPASGSFEREKHLAAMTARPDRS